jgi:hypothetical protein
MPSHGKGAFAATKSAGASKARGRSLVSLFPCLWVLGGPPRGDCHMQEECFQPTSPHLPRRIASRFRLKPEGARKCQLQASEERRLYSVTLSNAIGTRGHCPVATCSHGERVRANGDGGPSRTRMTNVRRTPTRSRRPSTETARPGDLGANPGHPDSRRIGREKASGSSKAAELRSVLYSRYRAASAQTPWLV